MNKFLFLLGLLAIYLPGKSQQAVGDSLLSREKALNVYLDCNSCDMTYFRENFKLINYVRDRKVADVQIIVSTMENGGGGREYMFQFYGLGRFSSLHDTLTFNSKADATDDEIRKQQLDLIQKGLVPFIMKTPYAHRLKVIYKVEEQETKEKDPWNNWVFNIGGNAWLNGQQSYQSTNIWASMSASRITESIKHQTELDYNYNEDKYRLYDQNDSLVYSAERFSKSISFGHSTIWSLGEHWGAGIELNVRKSIFSNIDLGLNVSPAIEYNVFKYSDASRKQLRFAYRLGGKYNDYTDTTIYNKIEEYLVEERLEINYKYITNWGSIRSGVYWNNYMHDFSLYSISTDLSMSIRLFKGLSLNLFGSVSMPRNQIGLKKGAVTPEDVLLRQQELATQYRYFTSIGLNYTFGSIYNNIVNPRLD